MMRSVLVATRLTMPPEPPVQVNAVGLMIFTCQSFLESLHCQNGASSDFTLGLTTGLELFLSIHLKITPRL